MELRHLRTFVAVAELRHFARAASLCNLSQPAVSHQIALLEGEVGARLLNRAARRVSLTVAGEVFLDEARRILGATSGIGGVRGRVEEDRNVWTAPTLLFAIDPTVAGLTPEAVVQALRHGDPPIMTRVHRGELLVDPHCLRGDEASVVARRLREELLRSSNRP